jgi:hypothetical protein
MPNLTIDERIVREVPLAPLPGHALVVYKRIEEGKAFVAELNPEEQFREQKTSWWKRLIADPPSYTAYAVNIDKHLRLNFSRRILHQNQVNSCDIIFNLEYAITGPRVIVTRLENDPLAKVQSKVVDLALEVISRHEWRLIKNQFDLVATEAVDHMTSHLTNWAADFGIKVHQVKLGRQLLDRDVKVEKYADEKRIDIGKLEVDKDAEKKRRILEHESGKLQAALDRETKELQLRNDDDLRKQELDYRLGRMKEENAVANNELMRKIRSGGADSAVRALDTIAGEMNSVRQLEEALLVLQRLSMKQVGGEVGPTPQFKELGVGVATAEDVSSGGDVDTLSKVAALLVRTFHAVRDVKYSAVEKTQLVSALLHLTAEAMLGDETSDRRLQEYHDKLKNVVERLSYFTSSELERFVIDNYSFLREKLR